MTISLGVVMDPLESIVPYKDTTFAMMLAAQARGWDVFSISQHDIYIDQGKPFARRRKVHVVDDNHSWFEAEPYHDASLSAHNIILMRKDPPFNLDYIYTTYILELAEADGVLVSNRPASLRDVNEKLYTSWFSDLCPPTLVTADSERLKSFVHFHQDVIIKPLDGMGGAGIYRLTPHDPNINIILNEATVRNRQQIMAQRYVPEITDGDKRVLVVNGKAIPFALARIPAQGETRGNLAAGGRGVPVPVGIAEQKIVERVAPELIKKGLLFVGLDIIGSVLTEINVTSPTCARELDSHMRALPDAPPPQANGYQRGISDIYLDTLENALHQPTRSPT